MLVFIGLVLLAAAIAAPLLFIRIRNSKQDTLDFERAVEMVTMLIHLPPMSEDTEVSGRDVRDIVDENISKAQIIYNIIASATEKSMKARWFGQRHFGFEIVGSKGFVHLYANVPADMVDTLGQALTSAYPSVRLEVTPEHNIFSQVGGINGVVGGEFNLKESFAYPIATYQDLKRDALQSILNALSGMQTDDGAAIQILFRPADNGWRRVANEHASQKRKGHDGLTVGTLARDVMTAFVKPPEGKEGESSKKELSGLEQSIVDAIDDKTRYAGFEVTIRVVASSNILQRSQAIMNNVVASFALFDSPGKNGFKYEPAKDNVKLVEDFVLRKFAQHKKRNIMNSVELATLFHFPDQSNIPTSQLRRQESKQVDGPRDMPDTGLLLGFNVFRGVKKPIRLDIKDRQRHMYAVGQTGTGKSTFLENLALQDMLNGDGFAFVDPHGDTAEKLLGMVPKERTEDVIYFCPSDMDYPMGLNLFEFSKPDQKDFIIQEIINMLYKLYDPQHQGIMGPRYEDIFRNAAIAVMADPAGGTFVEIPQLFRDPAFLKHKLQYLDPVRDKAVLDYWQKQYPASQRSNEAGEVTAWFTAKFGAFLNNDMMRNIIGQTKSAFDLRHIMDNKKILLVNLSKGRTGDLNSKLLGMIFVMKFQAAAMSRSDQLEVDRKDFCLYVDEFQNFSTDSFATIMSEARKFHLNLIVANQFTTQLTEEIRDAVFGNIGTIVSFRVGQNDVEALGRYFQPAFDADDLLRVPNFNSIVRTLVNGVPTQPFSMAALPPLGSPNMKLTEALKQLSAAKYGKPRAVVEKMVAEHMTPKEPEHKSSPNPFGPSGPGFGGPGPAGGSPLGGSGSRFGDFGAPSSRYIGYDSPTAGFDGLPAAGPQRGGAGATAPSGTGSFLDEWLAKQRSGPAAPARYPSPPTAGPSPSSAPAAGSAAPAFDATPVSPAVSAPVAPTVETAQRPVTPPASVPAQPQAFTAPVLDPQPSVSPNRELDMVGEADGGNVSSAQLDQQEIKDIAQELKKTLRAPGEDAQTAATAPLVDTHAGPLDVKPAPGPLAVPAGAAADQKGPAPGDTIFIDKEGQFHPNDPAPDGTPPAAPTAP